MPSTSYWRAVGALAILGAASPALGRPYTVDEILALAKRHNPGLAASGRATAALEAHLLEARRSWMPSGEILTMVAPTPEIRCEYDAGVFPLPAGVDAKAWREEHCARTNISEASVNFRGVLSRTELRLVQPLYTFGKITAGREAAEAGVAASRQREYAAAADLELTVRRAYQALKLAREIQSTLHDGLDYLKEAEEKIEKDLASGDGDATVTDRLRMRTVRADVDARMLEAKRMEQVARAGLRALLGPDAPFDIDPDDEPLAAAKIPARALAYYEEQARLSRPEVKALDAFVEAKRALATFERRKQYPDLVLMASATFAYASAIDNPQNAFASDPFNTLTGGLAAALRMPLDLGVRNARAQRVDAEAEEATLRRREALGGIYFEVERAYAELGEAQARAEVIARGEKAAKSWISAVAQNFAAGLAEAKDFSDALLAFFQMRVRLLQAYFDVNVAAAALSRATGARVDAP